MSMATDQQLTKIYYNPNHPASFSNSKKLGLACKKKIRKKTLTHGLRNKNVTPSISRGVKSFRVKITL